MGLISAVLCKIPLTPMSVEELLNKAPNHVLANITNNVSTEFAPTSTILSPLPTPLTAIAAASRPASLRSAAQLTCLVAELPSRTSVRAILASSLPLVERVPGESVRDREYSTFSAQLRRTPSNQRGTASMGWDSSMAVV